MGNIYEFEAPLVGNFLTPQQIGENIADLCARLGVAAAPLPTKLWKFDNAIGGNSVEVIEGTRNTTAISTPTSIPGGIKAAVNNRGLQDTHQITGTAQEGSYIVAMKPYGLPGGSGFTYAFRYGGKSVILHWNHTTDPAFRGVAAWFSQNPSAWRNPSFNVVASDLNKIQAWGSNYSASREAAGAFIAGQKRGSSIVALTNTMNNDATNTKWSESSSPLPEIDHYWTARWDHIALTDEQTKALTLFPHALASWYGPAVYFDMAVVPAGVLSSRARFGRPGSIGSRARFGGR